MRRTYDADCHCKRHRGKASVRRLIRFPRHTDRKTIHADQKMIRLDRKSIGMDWKLIGADFENDWNGLQNGPSGSEIPYKADSSKVRKAFRPSHSQHLRVLWRLQCDEDSVFHALATVASDPRRDGASHRREFHAVLFEPRRSAPYPMHSE